MSLSQHQWTWLVVQADICTWLGKCVTQNGELWLTWRGLVRCCELPESDWQVHPTVHATYTASVPEWCVRMFCFRIWGVMQHGIPKTPSGLKIGGREEKPVRVRRVPRKGFHSNFCPTVKRAEKRDLTHCEETRDRIQPRVLLFLYDKICTVPHCTLHFFPSWAVSSARSFYWLTHLWESWHSEWQL